MDNHIDSFWNLNLVELKRQLDKNGFDTYVAASAQEARSIVLEKILPDIRPGTVSWGGSLTFAVTGLHDYFRHAGGYEALDTWDKSLSDEAKLERRRQALLVDCFFTSTNAVTAGGHLVNLDMIGNRNGAITFGPRNVVIFLSRNKVVPDLERAMQRIKDYVAPVNAMRLDMKTPCVKTGYCMDCNSPQRICNVWTVTEKSFPKGRIKIVLINEDMGF